jgi:hypothetical protein
MGHAYAITDGTTTFTLTSTNSMVLTPGYTPATGDGNAETVTDSIPLMLYSTTAALLQTAIAGFQTLLNTARRRKVQGIGPQLYLTVQLSSDAAAWRSRIIDARLDLKEDSLNIFGQAKMTATLYLERVPYFEGALAELQLSANGQAAATGGRTVTNDPASGNWVQIAAAQVTGNLPAPVMLQLTNTIGSAEVYRRLFLAVNAYSDPANFVQALQGEAATGVTSTSSAACSATHMTIVNASANPVLKWTLTAAQLQRTQGRRVRIIARLNTSVSSIYVTPQIRDAAGTAILWQGDEISIGFGGAGGASYDDCGIVPMPPGGYGAVYGALTLALAFRGSETAAELDVLQLTPLDSYRYIELAPTSVANGESIVHDGIEEISYVLSGSTWLPLAASFGGALMLQPNTLQRIYILHDTVSNADAPVGNTFSARAYFRPRRSTV